MGENHIHNEGMILGYAVSSLVVLNSKSSVLVRIAVLQICLYQPHEEVA